MFILFLLASLVCAHYFCDDFRGVGHGQHQPAATEDNERTARRQQPSGRFFVVRVCWLGQMKGERTAEVTYIGNKLPIY